MSATWTPATDPTTLPRASAREGDFGSQRVYFFDLETRTELKDHPLNGMYWSSSGAMVSHQERYVDGTILRVSGTAYLNGEARRVTVDADSFPGRKVVVKTWHGQGETNG